MNKSKNNYKTGLSSRTSGLLDLFEKNGIDVRVTSGKRTGGKTKQGRMSHHSTGDAFDLVPTNGNWDSLIEQIQSNPDILSYMQENKLGVLDERTPEMLKKTGGTGPHFHIGPDKIALKGFEKLFGNSNKPFVAKKESVSKPFVSDVSEFLNLDIPQTQMFTSNVSDEPMGTSNIASTNTESFNPSMVIDQSLNSDVQQNDLSNLMASFIDASQQKAVYAMGGKVKRKYAMGGEIPVEVEGGEMFQIPGQGTGQEIDGPTHEEGGVDANLPEGTIIYSDRISVEGKTLAARKKARDNRLKKLAKRFENNSSDVVIKNTIQRSVEAIQLEDEADKAIMSAYSGSGKKMAMGTPYLQNIPALGPQYLTVPPIATPTITSAQMKSTVGSTMVPTTPAIETVNNSPSMVDAMGGTTGMVGTGFGLASTVAGAIGSIMNTKANLDATKNLNKDYFEDFGLDAINTNKAAQERLFENKQLAKTDADRKLAIDRNTQRQRNRKTATGINTIRALDTVSDLAIDRATTEGVSQLEQIFGNQELQLLGQKGQLELQRDSVTMGSKAKLQEEEEQRLDSYFTNVGQNIASISTAGQKIGADINKVAYNQNLMSWMDELSPYFSTTAKGFRNKTSKRVK